MSQLEWNQTGKRFFETGVDRGVLYPRVGNGVPWNGLVGVNESSSGGDVESLYYDGVKYLDLIANEDFQAVIETYAAPPEFAISDGNKHIVNGLYVTQQRRQPFAFSYRTLLGNDLQGTELGYKLHLVWGCMASPSSKNNSTMSNTTNPGIRQWTVNTVAPASSTYKPSAHMVVDSTAAPEVKLQALEDILYGDETTNPRMPTQAQVIAMFA